VIAQRQIEADVMPADLVEMQQREERRQRYDKITDEIMGRPAELAKQAVAEAFQRLRKSERDWAKREEVLRMENAELRRALRTVSFILAGILCAGFWGVVIFFGARLWR
jgi:high-affinity Fe2+/Pb2+ permease